MVNGVAGMVIFFWNYGSHNAKWIPMQTYDLISIVHGLHYVGDKLGLIMKAASALKPDGLFIGNLDVKNIQIEGCPNSEKVLKSFFKTQGIDYNSRTKMVKIVGQKRIEQSFVFCGANDKVGPNYTGQGVVDSIYEMKTQI
jgi:SAM-dependent methyltransferase